MRSYVKKSPRQSPHEPRRFAPRGEIALPELQHVLQLSPKMVAAIADSYGFPPPLGKRYHGERVWLLSQVADYFERIGWPADARALREWGG